MIELAGYLEIATIIAREAGDFLGSKFGPVKLKRHLSGTHYGIAEDVECDLVYRKYLAKKTPKIPVLSEENYERVDGLTWIVDAVEGTSNYSVGNPRLLNKSSHFVIPASSRNLSLIESGTSIDSVSSTE